MTCNIKRGTAFRRVPDGFICRLCNVRFSEDELERHKKSKGHRKVNRYATLRGFGDGGKKEMA